MKRITKQIKGIADAHIRARMNDRFDDTPVMDLDDLKRNVLEGRTYRSLMDGIEVEYSTITSCLMARQFRHASDAYKSAIYKGFRELFNKWYL
jgi:hypothetical protein